MARPNRFSVLIAAFAGVAGLAEPAGAGSPFLATPDAAFVERSPAYRYANMTDAEAFAELDRRRIIYSRVAPVEGVRAPIRLTARLHGVWFHSSLPPERRVTSLYEILDARLALALDDFAAVLERHDIDEVVHYTMYRPNVSHDGVADAHERRDKVARGVSKLRDRRRADRSVVDKKGRARKSDRHAAPEKQKPPPPAKARPAGRPSPPGTRHPAGLAIDVGGFRKKDGRWLSVGWHFQGVRGERTCGEGARVPEQPDARELRSIVCEASDLGLFTYVLTPNYDAAHADHYHMEIKPGVRWFLVH